MILQADNFNNGPKYLIHIKKLYLAKRQIYLAKRQKNAYAIKGYKKIGQAEIARKRQKLKIKINSKNKPK